MVNRIEMDPTTKQVKALHTELRTSPGSKDVINIEDGGEVILSGGAINSPQLLMLSGIGDAEDLKLHGINSVVDLPGVGQNLQDHLELYVQHKCKQPITLHKVEESLLTKARIGIQWFMNQTGEGATAHLEAGGFIRTRAGIKHPDVQFHFLPSVVNDHGRKPGDCHAFQVHVGTMRAHSRGYISLKSANPRDHPILQPNYMKDPRDMEDMRACVKLTREIFAQSAFDPFRDEEIQPGKSIQTDAEIDDFIRQKADSAYHPSCTVKMGTESDPMAVVDPDCKVIGTKNLRVVDASIMPSVVSGNLNGPTVMIAEKAADIILGKTPLAPSEANVWVHPEWETQQR